MVRYGSACHACLPVIDRVAGMFFTGRDGMNFSEREFRVWEFFSLVFQLINLGYLEANVRCHVHFWGCYLGYTRIGDFLSDCRLARFFLHWGSLGQSERELF